MLFDAFRKTDGAPMRRERGLGFGLAVANYIVKEHRGALRIDSPGPGRGTTVTVELPLAEPTAGVLAESRATISTQEAAPLAGFRVLLVDDDADTREALGEVLAMEGAEVRTAPSAKAALDTLSAFAPTVIVSEICLPERNGYWFIHEVRALQSPLAHLPALALTAHARPEDAQAAIAAGYQRQLTKPPEPRALTEIVAQLGAAKETAPHDRPPTAVPQ
jgi:CheY-like chemotaxis protein